MRACGLTTAGTTSSVSKGMAGNGRSSVRSLCEAIDRPLAGGLVQAHVGHLIAPGRRQGQVVLEAQQFVGPASQGVVLHVAHARLPRRLSIPGRGGAGDRLHTEIAAQGQELGMETGMAAGAVEHGRLEVVEDQVARTAAEEGQGVDQAPVELGLALRQGELDVEQAAVAEHGHEHRDLARGRADLHAAAFAPIDLHRLGRLVMHLLVDAAACWPDLAQVTAQDVGAAGVALGSTSDLLADAHGREIGILGQQVLDLLQVRIEQTGAPRRRGTTAAAAAPGRRPRCDASSAVAARSPGRRVFRSRRGGGSRPTKRRSWRGPPWVGSCGGSHLAEHFAEQHQPLARLRAAADARRRQRQHLNQRQLVGDQVAVEQFLPSLSPEPGGDSRSRLVSVWSL